MKIFITFFFLFFIHISIYGQYQFFEEYYNENNLVEVDIETIEQDSLGYLWVGTPNGLFRFDGFSFQNFDLNLEEEHPFITNIKRDNKQRLWISYFNKPQVSYYHLTEDRVKHFSFEEKDLYIVQIEFFKEKIWLFSQYGQIISIDEEKEKTEIIDIGKQIYSALFFQKDTWILGMDKGLCLYDMKSKTISYPKEFEALENVQIHDLKLDLSKTVFYIATDIGLFTYDIEQKKLYAPDTFTDGKKVLKIFISKDRKIWLGILGEGVITFDIVSGHNLINHINYTEKEGLLGKYISCFFEDRENSMWLGSSDSGLFRFLGDHFKFENISMGKIHFFFQDSKGEEWIGSNSDLSLKTPLGWEKILTTTGDNYMIGMVEKDENTLWIATYLEGLYQYDRKTKEVEKISQISPEIITKIYKTKDGNIWVSTALEGVYKYSNGSFKNYSTKNGFIHNYIHNIFEDSQNRVWFSAHNAPLSYFDKGELVTLDKIKDIYINYNTIVEDNNQVIWFGGYGNGIFKLENDTLIKLNNDNILDYIYTSHKDKGGNIWFTGKTQLIKIDNKQRIAVYDLLKYNEKIEVISEFITEDEIGNLYVGTNEGLMVYNPKRDYTHQVVPDVLLTKIYLFDQEKEKEDIRSLSYGEYRIKFEFQSISFIDKSIIDYRFFLEGYDNEWSPWNKQREIKYSRLSDGKYTFKVASRNNHYISPVTTLSFEIATPFWKQIWFYVITTILLFSLVYGYSSVRTMKLRKRNIQLELTVKERTKSLNDKKEELEKTNDMLEKQKFEIQKAYEKQKELREFKEEVMSMIVHDLKNPLTSIIILSEEQASIVSSAKQMLDLVNNILDVQKFKDTNIELRKRKTNLKSVIENSINHISILAENKGVQIAVQPSLDFILDIDFDMITRVFINILNNAIKYTSSGGVVKVDVSQKENQVLISIQDNGIGIPEADIAYIFDKFYQVKGEKHKRSISTGLGLSFCKMMVEAHEGEISVNSEENVGTNFLILLPFQTVISTSNQIKQINKKESQIISFTHRESKYLMSFIKDMKELKIYQTSENLDLLNRIELDTENINKWKERLEDTLFSFNVIQYNMLIDEIGAL